MRKTIAAIVFVVLFALGWSAFAESKRETYEAAQESFQLFIMGDDSIALDELSDEFTGLKNYRWSRQYALYIDVLKNVESNDFECAKRELEVLRANGQFCRHLNSITVFEDKCVTLEDLENYVTGRVYENEGKHALALEAYALCAHYLDATDRMVGLYAEAPEEEPAETGYADAPYGDMNELYEYENTITVYYGVNSRKYHRTAECQYMYKDEYKHTLYQALHVDFKDYCTLCNPMTEDEAMSRLAESKTE